MRTLSKYNRQINGLQIVFKLLFNEELNDRDCIAAMQTPEGKRLIAMLESLPPIHRSSKTVTISQR